MGIYWIDYADQVDHNNYEMIRRLRLQVARREALRRLKWTGAMIALVTPWWIGFIWLIGKIF